MTNTSSAHLAIGGPLRIRGLSSEHRVLIDTMREHQFGRIENMPVRDGQPIIDQDLKVVRATRMGGDKAGVKPPVTDDFEPKQAFRDLFDELERLNNGIVIKLEFRHGLPFLLETIAS